MDTFYRIVSLLGGLALFLYGMRIMGDGLKRSSGRALKGVLEKVTDKPVKGFLLGVLITCMIQSSTATIVLTVGLVGAGFLTFRQSTGIVLGANVGTAITAQIIRLMDVDAGEGSILYFFKSDNLAPMALIVGIILIMFIKKKSSEAVGTICIGFGILFVGLMNMSSAVSVMSDSLSSLLVSFEGNYLLGFLSGVLVTGIIQSSSAVIGILQSVASSVGIRFCAVFAVIIGVNIGDCITTYLVCRIGAKKEQIRTCLFHIVYNVLAATMLFLAILICRSTGILGDGIWQRVLRSGGVANVHGLFRLVPAVVLLPVSGKLANLVDWVLSRRGDEGVAEEDQMLRELDPRLVSNPVLALAESRKVLEHMCETALLNFGSVIEQLDSYDSAKADWLAEQEDRLDRMTDAVNRYIILISGHVKQESDNNEQNFQLKAMTVFERIGDLAVNIMHNLDSLREEGKTFSDTAMKELHLAMDAITDILELTATSFLANDTYMARRVEPLEEVIDDLLEELHTRHVDRMTHGKCDVFCGIEYQNILLHLERVSDQCSDLAVQMLGLEDASIQGHEHEYIHDLHHSQDPEYMTVFHSNYTKYYHLLDEI